MASLPEHAALSGISVWIDEGVRSGTLDGLPPSVQLNFVPDGAEPPPGVLEAEVLVPSSTKPSAAHLLERMPHLALVQVISAGVDWIEQSLPAGVTLCSARGTRDETVAEWAIAAILAMEKRLPAFCARQAAREWRHELLPELAGRRALIVGHGSIGRRLEDKLRALGVQTHGVATSPREGASGSEELPALIGHFEIVVVLTPLTELTRSLFDARMLARMRDGALLVNAARGAVLDTDALIGELRSGRLRAALDVTEPEPLPHDHPLWDAGEVLITPHVAGDSPEAARRAYRFVGEQLARYARGEPLENVVSGPAHGRAGGR